MTRHAASHPEDPAGEEARVRFRRSLGLEPTVEVRAPGRVNLVGEHTDHQEGLVLPVAVDRELVLMATATGGRSARIVSSALGDAPPFDTRYPQPRGGFDDLARGVVATFAERVGPVPGFAALAAGDLPVGAGMGSSAAFSVGLCLVLESLAGVRLDDFARARLAHHAERSFLAVPCGIMDPFACSCATAGHALFLDCRTERFAAVAVPRGIGTFVAVDSGITRTLRHSSYARRVAECEEAARRIRAHDRRVVSLRDVRIGELEEALARLDDAHARRARHVVTENDRVARFVRAIERTDAEECGRLLLQSHRSLSLDFEVSLPAIDRLVDLGLEAGALGGRLTGAGFGGVTLHLVPRDGVRDFGRTIVARYAEEMGHRARAIPLVISGGARLVE